MEAVEPDEILDRFEPVQGGGLLVAEKDAPIEAHEGDGVWRSLYQATVALLALAKRLIGHPALGDIAGCDDRFRVTVVVCTNAADAL